MVYLALGFTISGFSQKFDLGEINGADYYICIPENWNKGLVMYAHGYQPIGTEEAEYKEEVNDFVEIFTSRGFAYASSDYKRQGVVIKDGIEDTEALRFYFENRYGKPEICIITGHSMGGIITLATIEKYPSEYDGAMPLCGWLAPAYSLIKDIQDMLVIYDYLFGGNTGEIVTGKQIINAESVQRKLDEDLEMAKLFAAHYGIRAVDMAMVIEFNQAAAKETIGWLGGYPVGNTQTIYSGFGDKDTSLNKNVLRYVADPEAEEYVIQYNTPTGMISDPVLALHTTYDPILPVHNYRYYEEATAINQTRDLYVQQYVVRDGHCYFSNEEIDETFDQLVLWITQGIRPKNIYR